MDVIDVSGVKPLGVGERRVAAVAPASASQRIASPPADTTDAASTATELAARAPVDQDRVAMIKAAIAAGTFPLSPATIADRLIALRLEWRSNDPA